MPTEQFANNAVTTLASAITSGATSLTVASASGFPSSAQFRLRIDNELLLVTAGAGTTTWTVTRGIEGTTAAAHDIGAAVTQVLTAAGLLAANVLASTNDFRLTTESGVPISTSDRTAQGTIYLTPYKGNGLATYDSSVWSYHPSAEVSLVLSGLTSGKNYDVFAYWNGSALALELSAAWTNDTTRADAVARQDGVWVKNADKSRRLVGSVRTTGSATTEDSATKRFVVNLDNSVRRRANRSNNTSHFYNTTTWRPFNNSQANSQVEFLLCQPQTVGVVTGGSIYQSSSAGYVNAGVDSASATTFATSAGAQIGGSSNNFQGTSSFICPLGVGYHYCVILQWGSGTGSTQFNWADLVADLAI